MVSRLARRRWVRPAVVAGTGMVTAVLVAASLPAVAAAGPAPAPTIVTLAGGPGRGPARTLAISAFDVTVGGHTLLVADNAHDVVRAIDTGTAQATVVAGDGLPGVRGDGADARTGELNTPTGVVRDAAGVVYIADGNRIRAVGTDGTIRTVAGSTTAGFSGDGGPAAQARLRSVYGLAVDGSDNLYVADGGNHRVRVIDAATHRIRTLAGNGEGAASGDGGPAARAGMSPLNILVAPSGDVIVTDAVNNRVRRISHGVVTTIAGTGDYGFSGDGGPATAAELATPHGLALGPRGLLYVTDNGNGRVRRIDRRGVITTVAGNGGFTASGDGGPATAAGLADPFGVAVDASGTLYIAEVDGVRRVGSRGIISTLAGNGAASFGGDGGPATSAQLSDPQGLAVDAAGDVFVADDLNCRIRRVDHRSGVVSTVAGTGSCGFSGDGGPATAAQLDRPRAVALDAAGNLYIADTDNLRIRRVGASDGRIVTFAGTGALGPSGDGGPATAAALDFGYGIAVSPSGDVAVSQYLARTVRLIDARTGTIRTVVGTGRAAPLGDGGPATAAGLSWPLGLAYDRAGDLFVADTGHFRVRRVDAGTGTITTVAGSGTRGFGGDAGPATAASLHGLNDVVVAADGTIYLSDGLNHRVRAVRHGVITTLAGAGTAGFAGDGGPAAAATLADPRGLALGADGVLLVADGSSGRVRAVTGLG